MEIMVGDYISHKDCPSQMGFLIEYYTHEQWLNITIFQYHKNPRAVCKVKWLNNQMYSTVYTQDYYYVDRLVRIEENLKYYLRPD